MTSQSTLPNFLIAGFTQFVADNLDQNLSFLDGRGLFLAQWRKKLN